MAMKGNTTSSSRNLAAMVEEADYCPPLSPIRIPKFNPFAASDVPPTPRHSTMWKRTAAAAAGGPFTTGVPCNPETGVGLLAAVVAPASAYLRVAEAARPAAEEQLLAAARLRAFRNATVRGIMAVSTDDLCCNGACDTPYCGGSRRAPPLAADGGAMADAGCCHCCRPFDGQYIYMYMGLAFCRMACRYDFFMERLYEVRQREFSAAAPARSRRRVTGGVKLVTESEKKMFWKMFFT
ncbi:hypothetical protein ACP70R_005378 [Stipagrostis hirtigluma subsp. patula]